MKSLRTSLAAAALLVAPAAALLVSTPAAAEHRAVVAQDDGWGYRYHRDQRPPRITDVTPDHGDRVGERRRTRISARFHDGGSGVESVALRVDGRDVTGWSRINSEQIRYREDLAPGRHVAEVIVRDRAGNVNRRAWSFVVVNRDRNYGYGYGRHDQPYRW